MLSIANVGGSDEAGRYYEKADDYYTKGKSPSEWQGKAAEYLNLRGEVKIEDFKRLLDGVLPSGEAIKLGGSGRRGGSDLTFSAPKSVSMQALIGGDPRLIAAHDRAVAVALRYAEGLVGYRKTTEGTTEKIRSGNLLAATFRHELSRACDPQLHTHCVVLNMTRRDDGKWRATDNELLYRQKMLMGALYRAELAREIQKLGYKIRVPHPDGRFELRHISDPQLESFSQRSQAIEEALKEKGKTRETASPQEKQILTIATRPRKTDVDRQILSDFWKEKSREAKIKYEIKLKENSSNLSNLKDVFNIVNIAMEHGLERQSVITEAQILREALKRAVGFSTHAEIKGDLDRRVKAGLLIRSGDRYTTPEAIEREKNTLRMERRGRGRGAPLLEANETKALLKGRGLNRGQKEAVTLVLSSPNRVMGVQGLAGTGKTFMLETARELAQNKGYKMIGVAPSAAAANELSKTGIESKTISSFQTAKDPPLNSKTILVVDEAGMVSSQQMEFLLKAAERYNSKVLLIGDTQQLKAVEAGKPFAQLQAHGMATAGMSEIQRQKNPELKKAVELAAKGRIHESVSLLQKSVHELDLAESRYAKIAQDYVSISEKDREKTLIVSGTNEARKAINQKVREGLGLQGRGNEIEILEAKDLTKIQIKEIRNYRPGDFIQFERNYRMMGVKTGDLCPVHQIKPSYILLRKQDGSLARWRPQKRNRVSVFQSQKRELALGEVIRLTKNDRAKGLMNGERARVIGIDIDKTIHLQKENGKKLKIDGTKPLHLDHGYCSTVHSAQGKTCEKILIEADTKSLTSARDNYYVAISRARREAKIYTNDRAKLPEAMNRMVHKEVALELGKNHA